VMRGGFGPRPSLPIGHTMKPSDPPIPYFTKEQIDFLNTRYPERCPEPAATDREIWMQVGQRQVVRLINRLYQEQVERSLTGKK